MVTTILVLFSIYYWYDRTLLHAINMLLSNVFRGITIDIVKTNVILYTIQYDIYPIRSLTSKWLPMVTKWLKSPLSYRIFLKMKYTKKAQIFLLASLAIKVKAMHTLVEATFVACYDLNINRLNYSMCMKALAYFSKLEITRYDRIIHFTAFEICLFHHSFSVTTNHQISSSD